MEWNVAARGGHTDRSDSNGERPENEDGVGVGSLDELEDSRGRVLSVLPNLGIGAVANALG